MKEKRKSKGRTRRSNERWKKRGRMNRTTWRKLKKNKGMKEENKMENTNFKKDGMEGEDQKRRE
jgi:hypothetical protein